MKPILLPQDHGGFVTYEKPNLHILGDLFKRELENTPSIVHMPGFKFMPSETPDMFRLFFRHICQCGGAALFTLEISKKKELAEIMESIPALVSKLNQQKTMYVKLSCETHQRMSNGGKNTPSDSISQLKNPN